MERKYTYDDFLDIMKQLRGENGCPWDKVQTHDSLRPCLMEESAEVLAAIRILDQTGNPDNLREELGDVLLQVVMHAQIAEEEQLFTMEDVVDEVARKMIRRHPHVFGTGSADNPEQVLQNWEEIKKQEKQSQSWAQRPLRDIPAELPALTRAAKVLKKAGKEYGVRRTYEDDIAALQQAVRDLGFLCSERDARDLEKPLGEILMAVSDLAAKYGISTEQLLRDEIENFIESTEK